MKIPAFRSFFLTALLLTCWGTVLLPAQPQPVNKTDFKFDFGTGQVADGYTPVTPDMVYSPEKGFGFFPGAALRAGNQGGKDALRRDFVTSDQPFFFTVDVPEGNYNVTVTLGDRKGTSKTTVKAECRRLMLEEVSTKKRKFETRSFTVHVRNPQIGSGGDKVRLKSRELSYLHWDNQLTLEFNNSSPKVCAIEIARVDDAVTVFLAGNSTVVDQSQEPWAAWGQMIPVFFQPGKVAVANYAESGETLRAFAGEKRLAKILSLMKPGDYLFIEFAHNDQKPGGTHVDAFTTYKEELKRYIGEARRKGGIPVLVTSMHRRRFDDKGRVVNTLADYPEAARQTAREENVALIDLNEMSKAFYEALGPEQSKRAFVHYPANAFPGQTAELKDDTHFSTYGAYQLAKCVVAGIRKADPGLARHLLPHLPPYNPAQPDPVANWNWPLSPPAALIKPDGN
jgi:lysophospholipase L1-like esterase